jgi:predicted Zn-dependent protease
MNRRLAIVLLALAACARNPVTGERQLSLVSTKDEIELGKQAAAQVRETMPAYPDRAMQEYVAGIGKRIAAASERPDLPWTFEVIDDATVNAFALPGGPVFVTRGLVSYLNDEAELAAVLGHEIAHVTARHSVEQISKAQLAQLGLGLGMVFSPELREYGQVAGAGLQVLFLKFGRDDERQADELGFRYMLGQGYDPRRMADVFVTLGRASKETGGGRVLEWLLTHPDPENRTQVARERAASVKDADRMKVGRETHLARVDGMTFGEDPRQGFFQGNAFLHPALRFRMDFPEGWAKGNTPGAVVALSPKKDAALQLSIAGKASPEEARRKFFAQPGVKPAAAPSGSVAAGPPGASYFDAQTKQGAIGGLVSFVAHGGVTYGIVGYAAPASLAAYDSAFRSALASFAPLTDPAALAVQPARIELVKVPRDMTVAEFAAAFPSTVALGTVATINGVPEGGTLRAGQSAKRVVVGLAKR